MKKTLKLLTVFVSLQAIYAMEQNQLICSGNSWLESQQHRVAPSLKTVATQTEQEMEDLAFFDFVQRKISSSPEFPVGNLRLLWEYTQAQMALRTLGRQCLTTNDLSDYFAYRSEEPMPFIKEGHGDVLSLIVMIDNQLSNGVWALKTHHQLCHPAFLASFDEIMLMIKGCITTFEKELQRIKAEESQ
jgi:hypothetical protein